MKVLREAWYAARWGWPFYVGRTRILGPKGSRRQGWLCQPRAARINQRRAKKLYDSRP